MTDYRLPEHRRGTFQRFYSFHLKYRSHPGCVYAMLPAIAEAYDLDDNQRAWLVWLNGNTQNAVTSLLLLEAAPTPDRWRDAVAFWNEHFKALEWDTDRRHQKGKFAEATEMWFAGPGQHPAYGWLEAAMWGWDDVWRFAKNQPYMGRLSAWSMIEYARILLPGIPDAGTWLLEDKSGSRSHRNGLAFIAGHDAVYWDADTPDMLGLVPDLNRLGDSLLDEATTRNPGNPDVSRLTLESALCTYKSWHKPNRRYANVYSDMFYQRIRRAEARFGPRFDLLWQSRKEHLPAHLRLEDNPYDPGLAPVKQNHYLETGEPILLHHDNPDIPPSQFDLAVAAGGYGLRKDPRWT